MISILPGTQHIGAQWTPQPWMRESQKRMESPRICEFVLSIRGVSCFFFNGSSDSWGFLPPYTISAKTVIQIASEFTIYVIVIIVIIIMIIIIIFLIIIFLIYVLKSSHLTQEPSLPPVLRKQPRISSPCPGRSSSWSTIATTPAPWICWSRASSAGILRQGHGTMGPVRGPPTKMQIGWSMFGCFIWGWVKTLYPWWTSK